MLSKFSKKQEVCALILILFVFATGTAVAIGYNDTIMSSSNSPSISSSPSSEADTPIIKGQEPPLNTLGQSGQNVANVNGGTQLTTPEGNATNTSTTPTLTIKTSSIMDDFSGTSLNTALWQPVSYPKGYRNNEEQEYTPNQIKVSNGKLVITATRGTDGAWRSGELHSKWKYTYGDFEVRMALGNAGPGVWPAAWLLNGNEQWPLGGEIDIMENINGETSAYATVHGGGSNGHWQTQYGKYNIDVKQYHTYKIVKKPNTISWWVDGVKAGEWSASDVKDGNIWPFEQNSNYAILNLAIGGNWPGPSTSATPNNIDLYVDYFKVSNAY